MPWKETYPMKERQAFIDAWLKNEFSFRYLCSRFGISPKTGYKWVHRFKAQGQAGLGDRSRAPHHHPNATAEALIKRLLETKRRFPHWGPVTLIDYLGRTEPQRPWPAYSTAGEILKRHGLVSARQPRRRQTPPHTEPLRHANAVHALWSIDFKGDFLLGNARRCYPLTLSDNYSRFLIDCQGLYATEHAPTQACLRRAFRRLGLPLAIRSDNGSPFAQCGLGGLSALSIWLLKLGVLPERIAPGHPEQNPRHERMHRTLKRATASPPCANLSAQQRAFNRFRTEYNELRPHRALARGQCPGDLISVSPRPFPERLPEVVYPDHFLVRRIRSNGEFKWRGQRLYASSTLAGEPLGFEPLDEDLFQLYFAKLPLALFDARARNILRPNRRWR